MTARGGTVLLGTPVDDVTLGESIEAVAAMVATGRRTGRVHQVATVNVDFVVNAAADDGLRAIMRDADLSIPDGMGVVWGARALRTGLRERSAGVDLVPALAVRAAHDGWRLCLFGGAPGVADRAADALRERAPGVDIVVVPAPEIGADGSMDEAVVSELRAARADVIGVALGNPKQERWIACHGEAVGVPVLIGIGGTLDFLTGTTRRAPAWMQRSGLEWVHRALSEPRRLMGRYAHDLRVFAPALVAQMWRGRRRRDRGALLIVDDGDAGLTIDLSAVHRLDNRTVAQVATAQRVARLAGRPTRVVGATVDVLRDAERLAVVEIVVRS